MNASAGDFVKSLMGRVSRRLESGTIVAMLLILRVERCPSLAEGQSSQSFYIPVDEL